MKKLRRDFNRFCFRNRDKGIPNLMLYVTIGTAIVYFHKPIADNFAHGINSYDRVKLVGVIAILIIFQPEIRHFLQVIGRQRERFEWLSRIFNLRHRRQESDFDLDPIVLACQEMGAEKVGALIILKQSSDLSVIEESGIAIDAKVSTPLIENVFFKNAPLHDGAMVIHGSRVVAAKCVLPSTQQEVPKSYGMRHRAALGMSEVSDAIIIAVSEETGQISLAHASAIKRNIDPQNLASAIRKLMRKNDKRREEEQAK